MINTDLLVAIGTFILAIAAVAQFELLRRTSQKQLRAYIFLESATIVDGTGLEPKPFVDRTDQPGVWITIKNTGQTPAHDVLHWGQIDVVPSARISALNSPLELQSIHSMVLPPSVTATKGLWLERSLSAQEKDGIRNGSYAVVVYGRITYKDAFGKNHWSVYRMQYTAAAWPPINNSASMSFCADGNKTD